MPVHRQPERRSECPGEGSLGSIAIAAGTPQPKQRLLGNVAGLIVAETEAPNEAPDVLTVQDMDIFDNLPRGGS